MSDQPNLQRNDRRTVMISSTARDLPYYLQRVLDGCHPVMMEHFTALNAHTVRASLDMVDSADIYLGNFAYRYGWVPGFDNPEATSITEREYNRAVERGIPRRPCAPY